MKQKLKNKVKYMGAKAFMSPTTNGDSSSRIHMAFSMMQQAVVPRTSDIPRILNGFEKQMSDFTFGCRVPENLQVHSVINKYTPGISAEAIKTNPLITVIYRSLETGDYGVFHIESYQNQIDRVHETFSFMYEFTDIARNLHPGMILDRETVLSHSKNVKKNGMYTTSLNANVAYMSIPATAEDGFVVSESFLHRAQPIAYGSRVAEWGKRYYPINLYGDEHNYKPFPEIGDYIRPDGLIFALRKYDDMLEGLEMTEAALMEPDYLHDKLEYGKPNAKVCDVNVHTTTNEHQPPKMTPIGMEVLAKRYSEQHSLYYDAVTNAVNEITRSERDGIRLSPALQSLAVEALGDKPNLFYRRYVMGSTRPGRGIKRNSIVKTYRATPIDEWRVEVTYTYRHPISEGAKFTNLHGGKGVDCFTVPDADMPVDDWGNRADIIVYEKGAISRLNPGQFYEQYINAVARDVSLDIRKLIEDGKGDVAWEHLLGYMDIASPPTAVEMRNLPCDKHINLLMEVVKDGIYTHIPADAEYMNLSIYGKLQAYRAPNKSCLTYRDISGKMTRTIRPALIGSMAILVLDKLDHKPMAVSGVLRQHHSLPAVQNKQTKHGRPTKEQPPRAIGESESRAGAAILGGKAIADFIDVAASPAAHRAAVAAIARADNPAQIDKLFDRKKIPRNPPTLAFVKHVLSCSGVEITDGD